MGAARIMVIVVAFIAAIGVVFLLRGVVFDKKGSATQAESAQPMVQVLVAKRDLPIGTQLKAGDIGWQQWPAANMNPAYTTNGQSPTPAPNNPVKKAAVTVQAAAVGAAPMEQLYGAIVKEPMLNGEPILARKVVRGGQGGYMAVVLQPGMRAMAISVNVETGTAGWVLPGDRVDILQSQDQIDASGKNLGKATRTVVQNIRVLAIDQKVEPDKDAKTVSGTVATLEVAPDSAAALVDAKARGAPLFLTLRSYADLGGPSGLGNAAQAQRPVPIRIFRNGHIDEVAVTQ
ncbi:MAG TPA: Flp pilus assembly protein CpaB [Caulobacteraceae bacterium]|nr:Flp pilus assembly protein CpaB [Caulobacteraceae bacterium]